MLRYARRYGLWFSLFLFHFCLKIPCFQFENRYAFQKNKRWIAFLSRFVCRNECSPSYQHNNVNVSIEMAQWAACISIETAWSCWNPLRHSHSSLCMKVLRNVSFERRCHKIAKCACNLPVYAFGCIAANEDPAFDCEPHNLRLLRKTECHR